jgi:8-oxo-dGTP diphosphatase
VVTAAVIQRDDTYLVTRRLKGSHLEDYWEFPGGKCEPGEPHAACLAREIEEELGCAVRVGDEVLAVTHDYAERRVELHFFRCALLGEPRPLLGQDVRWAARTELASLRFPPADEELIQLLAT